MNTSISVDNAEDRSHKYMTELLHSTQMKYLIHRYNNVIIFVLDYECLWTQLCIKHKHSSIAFTQPFSRPVLKRKATHKLL